MKIIVATAFAVIFAIPTPLVSADDLNALILDQIKQMPQGGRYSVSRFAKIRLQSAAHFESGKFFILPSAPYPSFCSGATYLVFIKTIETLRARGELHLDFATLEQLIIRDQRDGEGIWGRWNANGPGTARLFHELGLGRNFDNFNEARPGDFMKIFWSREVGRSEHGHSTIFLGIEPARRGLRPLLVEQHSVGLRRKECVAQQDCLRNLLAARDAGQSIAHRLRAGGRFLSCLSPAEALQLRRGDAKMRPIIVQH